MDSVGKYTSPLGDLLLTGREEGLTGLYLNRPIPAHTQDLPVFRQVSAWLDDYFRGKVRPVDFPVCLEGTPFQLLIWQLLQDIPWGETRTYGQLAAEAAELREQKRMSAQAVGQAVGKNPVSIVIPCHRCVGAGGKMTGYAGGIHNKIWLLAHEGRTAGHTERKE